jgi:hypothetical protein
MHCFGFQVQHTIMPALLGLEQWTSTLFPGKPDRSRLPAVHSPKPPNTLEAHPTSGCTTLELLAVTAGQHHPCTASGSHNTPCLPTVSKCDNQHIHQPQAPSCPSLRAKPSHHGHPHGDHPCVAGSWAWCFQSRLLWEPARARRPQVPARCVTRRRPRSCPGSFPHRPATRQHVQHTCTGHRARFTFRAGIHTCRL